MWLAQASAPAVAGPPLPATAASAAEAALQLWQQAEALPGILAAEALAAATVLRQQEVPSSCTSQHKLPSRTQQKVLRFSQVLELLSCKHTHAHVPHSSECLVGHVK